MQHIAALAAGRRNAWGQTRKAARRQNNYPGRPHTPRLPRMPGLDGLRALAVVAVLF